MIPTFLVITILVYFLCRTVPGGPIERAKERIMMAQLEEGSQSSGSYSDELDKFATGELSAEDKADLMAQYNITDNPWSDYFSWLGRTLSGDLGISATYNEPVTKLIINRMPISIFYGIISMFFIYGICVPLGVIKALKNESLIDNASSFFVFVAYAIPGYAFGAILLVYFAGQWQWLPLGGFVSDQYDSLSFWGKISDLLQHAILPMSCYLIGSFAFMTMLVKNTMLDNLSYDYIRTALAKGVPYKKAVFKHALDNSLIPLATHFGNSISIIISGSFLIEKVFNIEGFGLLGFNSLESRDYEVVMGVLAISCVLQMVGNLLSDICVAYVDPRVKFD
ncbi:ABC transporter permease [Lentisphaera profundi]|uniref:ABC transporter permease n=1 Tax=Lentisphaera profundi TaxID=1658616 RepID=A0ABY7VPQ9_9BACT|nr:ABC transporter permease [Lentisphaera profundi]WDE95692.1 ABC transporter permease [Lentisphaera profundi]